jgi:hypothetical protein
MKPSANIMQKIQLNFSLNFYSVLFGNEIFIFPAASGAIHYSTSE